MKYYKITLDQTFIGIVNSDNFLAQNPISHWLLSADEATGQYVEYNNALYRDYWMTDINQSDLPEFTYAQVEEISESEYALYSSMIEKNEEIKVEIVNQPVVMPIVPAVEENPALDFIRSSKLSEMSATCRKVIESGFDLELRGEIRHFSLDTQDQLNLISLSGMAATQELIPYHADGEVCIFYTAEEINWLVAAATSFKVYHTTYYNALKTYINALDTIEAIVAITYGTPIPDEYKSEVLKVIEQ